MTKTVVVMAAACSATNVVTNALREAGIDAKLILERPVPGWRIAARRFRRLGWRVVSGQVLFRLATVPVLEHRGRTRIAKILMEYGLDESQVEPTVRVGSVNDASTREILKDLHPAVVVVVGTRIISSSTLSCVKAPFINLHAGITPRYRGVHGGYWALAEGRPDLAGSTVHLVDPGIDTGLVLRQATFEVTGEDSFATYPFLHLAAGVPLLVDIIRDVLAGGQLVPRRPMDCGESRLWYHPSLWGYLSTRRDLGVR